ncbi:MAG: hypothetical protein H6835_02845 [Planctomycetes bacterium]|nr:hypothetical protein [Planctomycetota bacterium]
MSRHGFAFSFTLIVAASLTSQEANPPAAAPGAPAEAPSADSYSAHVATFWKDFAEHTAHLHGIVGVEGKQDEVLEFIRPRIDALVPGIAWSFSAGSAPDTHALLLSPEGNLDP